MIGPTVANQDSGISLSRTRVIFLSTDNSQSIAIQNHGQRTYLVKSVVNTTPEGQEIAPFMVTPPLFRLEANTQHTLRILRLKEEKLANDKESIFYLSTIVVPSSPKLNESDVTTMSARISVGVENIIKLFYRPSGLSMTIEQAEDKFIFTQVDNQLQVNNPTPYYLTFYHLTLDGTPLNVRNSVSMIPPFSRVSYPVKGEVRQVQWSVINDYGGKSKSYQATVNVGVSK